MGNVKVVIGENSDKPLYSNTKINTHAEMDALNKIKDIFSRGKIKQNKNKMDLVVLRVNKLGQLCQSAPCHHCMKELKKNNIIKISKLYFSKDDGTITCVKFDEWFENGNAYVSKGWKWLEKKNLIK
jgi:hypothetical protein